MMEPQVEFMNLFCDLVKDTLSIDVALDELPEAGGFYAESGAPVRESAYYGKSGVWKVPVLILAKSNDQEAGMNGLCKICNAIHNRAEYPSGESVAWLDAQTVTPPNKIGRDEAGRYLFSGIINCSIYC